MNKSSTQLSITSPSRLHLGFYGSDDNYGYQYGSIGIGINAYHTKLSICSSNKIISDLPAKYTSPILKYLEIPKQKNNFILSAISLPPRHIGLGSGSQLSLSVGKIISQFYKRPTEINAIAEIYKRGERSGTGIEIFKKGGFVVDSCKKAGMTPEVMFSSKFPAKWKVILINDKSLKGISGKKEIDFFNRKMKVARKDQSILSDILLRGILPSIIYKDFSNFSENITEFQKITASFYANKQNGVFLSPMISKIMKYIDSFDDLGIGQSSWGPLSYVFVESNLHAKELISIIENKFNVYNDLSLEIVSPCNSGYKLNINKK